MTVLQLTGRDWRASFKNKNSAFVECVRCKEPVYKFRKVTEGLCLACDKGTRRESGSIRGKNPNILAQGQSRHNNR